MIAARLAKLPWFLIALLIGYDTTLLRAEARQTRYSEYKVSPVRQGPKTDAATRRVATTAAAKAKVCSKQDEFKFHPTIVLTLQGRPGKMTTSDIALLQRSIIRAYNMVVNCESSDLTGAFLRLQHANITKAATKKATAKGSTTQTFQVVAAIQGDCRGCKANPFRLWRAVAKGTKAPSQQRRLQQQPVQQPQSQLNSGPPTSKPAQPKPVKPRKDCACSVPFKSSFLQAINTMVPLPPSVDRVLDVGDNQVIPTVCPKVKSFTTYLTVDFISGRQDPFDITSSQAQTQYRILQQAVLRAYNEANDLNKGNVCDPFFTVVTDVEIAVSAESGYGTTGLNRRRHLSSLSVFTFLIRATCQGCSSGQPLFDGGMNKRRGRRNLMDIWQHDDVEGTPQESGEESKASGNINIPESRRPLSFRLHRQLLVNSTCSCPANTTELRRPNINEYLRALNDQLEAPKMNGSLTIVTTAQNTLQVNPVNCTAQVTYFNAILAVDFEGNVSSFSQDQKAALGSTFQSTYNSLAQGNCDPFFRTVQTVQFVGGAPDTGRRRDLRDGTNRDDERQLLLPVSSILIFVSGRCRGCSDNSQLFDDTTSRMLGGLINPSLPTIRKLTIKHEKSRKRDAQQRVLQEGANTIDQCYCNFDSNAARAPTLLEFGTVYKTSVASAGATSTLTVATVDEPRNISVTFPPTEAPVQRTRTPTSAPTAPSSTIESSNQPIVATRVPTSLPTITVSSDLPSLSPSNNPSQTS